MNFWKNSKQPLTPPSHFRKIMLQFFFSLHFVIPFKGSPNQIFYVKEGGWGTPILKRKNGKKNPVKFLQKTGIFGRKTLILALFGRTFSAILRKGGCTMGEHHTKFETHSNFWYRCVNNKHHAGERWDWEFGFETPRKKIENTLKSTFRNLNWQNYILGREL